MPCTRLGYATNSIFRCPYQCSWYGDFLRVGSLEEDVAEALRLEKTVYLGDEGTGHITIGFEEVQASGIAEAREIVEPKKLESLGTGKKDTWTSDP